MTTDPVRAVYPEAPCTARCLEGLPQHGDHCSPQPRWGSHNMAAAAPLSCTRAASSEGEHGHAQSKQRNGVPK